MLRAGTAYCGSQSVSRVGSRPDDWTVSLSIDQCDWGSGYLCGTMSARASCDPGRSFSIPLHWPPRDALTYFLVR